VEALTRLECTRERSAWFERFNHERLAREDERHDSSTSEDESSKRLQWCLNNQWRPNFDPNGYERERENR